jgi:hypothetical protein
METPIIDCKAFGLGPRSIKVFHRAGFFILGDLAGNNGQQAAIRQAAMAYATDEGTVGTGRWAALAEYCNKFIECVRLLEFSDVVPEMFLCPLTNEIMRDPAITPSGNSYEWTALNEFLQANHMYPDNPTVEWDGVVPIRNTGLREAIVLYLQRMRRISRVSR